MKDWESVDEAGVRLDKWLWAARFFKTRQLAIEAINGGKVHVDGQRAKPGKTLRIGARVSIQKGPLAWHVQVTAISKQRGPATTASLLYEESEESRVRRQELVRQRREGSVGSPGTKPNKRDRRLIERFTRKNEY